MIALFAVGAAGFLLSGMVVAIVGGLIGFFIPPIYVGRAKSGRLKAFDNQLADMLNLVVNGLRAGFSTLQAMEAVSHEMPTPISDEFRRVVQEMQLGITMEDALEHLMRRIQSDDLDLVVTAINVQREVGGNLAEILDVISFTIRERVRIKGEISALTAQGRATAWVISALPIALVVLLYLVNRPYIMQFFNPETRACGIPLITLAGTHDCDWILDHSEDRGYRHMRQNTSMIWLIIGVVVLLAIVLVVVGIRAPQKRRPDSRAAFRTHRQRRSDVARGTGALSGFWRAHPVAILQSDRRDGAAISRRRQPLKMPASGLRWLAIPCR